MRGRTVVIDSAIFLIAFMSLVNRPPHPTNARYLFLIHLAQEDQGTVCLALELFDRSHHCA